MTLYEALTQAAEICFRYNADGNAFTATLAGRRILALRDSLPQQSAVPEGWKLVPLEPTSAMLEAGWKSGKDDRNYSAIREIHRAMLAAAPAWLGA